MNKSTLQLITQAGDLRTFQWFSFFVSFLRSFLWVLIYIHLPDTCTLLSHHLNRRADFIWLGLGGGWEIQEWTISVSSRIPLHFFNSQIFFVTLWGYGQQPPSLLSLVYPQVQYLLFTTSRVTFLENQFCHVTLQLAILPMSLRLKLKPLSETQCNFAPTSSPASSHYYSPIKHLCPSEVELFTCLWMYQSLHSWPFHFILFYAILFFIFYLDLQHAIYSLDWPGSTSITETRNGSAVPQKLSPADPLLTSLCQTKVHPCSFFTFSNYSWHLMLC